MKSDHIVFVDSREQVRCLSRLVPRRAGTKLVAVTADAAACLEEHDLPYDPVCRFAEARRLVSIEDDLCRESSVLAHDIESFVGERYERARFADPGFMSSQVYHIYLALIAVLTRSFLMRAAIDAINPSKVTVFDGIEPEFRKDGYSVNPWLIVIGDVAAQRGLHVETLQCPVSLTDNSSQSCVPGAGLRKLLSLRRGASFLRRGLRRAYPYGTRAVRNMLMSGRRSQEPDAVAQVESFDTKKFNDLRLLMTGSLGYDWGPIISALQSTKSGGCSYLGLQPQDGREWTIRHSGIVEDVRTGTTHDLGIGPPREDEAELRRLSELFEEWLNGYSSIKQRCKFLGLSLFPALLPRLRAMTCLGPGLVRYTDRVAELVVETVKPDVVCFFSMTLLADKRMARHCHEIGVPIVSYMHGVAYGAHDVPHNEMNDPAHADYFLTYGEGFRPRIEPVHPRRAKLVPVGSTRVEKYYFDRKPHIKNANPSIEILWLGEVSHRNTVCSAVVMEDTERYLLQKACLSILAKQSDMRITYRPYPHAAAYDGICQWIKWSRQPIAVDVATPMRQLIEFHDAVITTASNGTVWTEILALDKPLVLYCDPAQTPFLSHFPPHLDQACYWCKSGEELISAVTRLSRDRQSFLMELSKKCNKEFLRMYVLHKEDGRCVDRVLSFLAQIRRRHIGQDDHT